MGRFKYFNKILHQAEFYRVKKNTLVLNTLDLILAFRCPSFWRSCFPS
jgi:ABC-type polysaccharide transport system permease subunit